MFTGGRLGSFLGLLVEHHALYQRLHRLAASDGRYTATRETLERGRGRAGKDNREVHQILCGRTEHSLKRIMISVGNREHDRAASGTDSHSSGLGIQDSYDHNPYLQRRFSCGSESRLPGGASATAYPPIIFAGIVAGCQPQSAIL